MLFKDIRLCSHLHQGFQIKTQMCNLILIKFGKIVFISKTVKYSDKYLYIYRKYIFYILYININLYRKLLRHFLLFNLTLTVLIYVVYIDMENYI